jgi:hypothetical protein
MAKYAGVQFTLFLVDGYNLIASLSESATMGHESITQQTNQFGAGNETHTPLNVEKGELTVGSGFWDTASDPLHSITGGSQGVKRIVCAALEGNTIGQHFMGFEGAYDTKVELLDQRDGLTKANVTYLIWGDSNEGIIVQALAAFTADQTPPTGDTPVDYTLDPGQRVFGIASASKAAASIITMETQNGAPIAHGLTSNQVVFISGNSLTGPAVNGQQIVTVLSDTTFSVPVNTSGSTGAGTDGTFVRASTVAGGVGYLQVTAYSGFTGVVPSIMHSINDTDYAALIDFTSVTAIGKERKTVTGTVRRYLSSQVDVTGSGSITLFMGFCRN